MELSEDTVLIRAGRWPGCAGAAAPGSAVAPTGAMVRKRRHDLGVRVPPADGTITLR
jgi:hypothetical protein